jgi:hypothetical protein
MNLRNTKIPEDSAERLIRRRFRTWLLRTRRLSRYNRAGQGEKEAIVERFLEEYLGEKAVACAPDSRR